MRRDDNESRTNPSLVIGRTIRAAAKWLSKALGRLRSSDRGAALFMTGIAMAALVGFTALAVDGGYMYLRHTELQDLADAAALSAARELAATSGYTSSKQSAAFQAALKCVQRNGFSTSGVCGFSFDVSRGDEQGRFSLTFPSPTTEARVNISLDAQTFFAKALSLDKAPIGVTATAEVLTYDGESEGTDLIPLAYWQGDYKVGEKTDMTLTPGEGVQGNYGWLSLGCTSKFEDYLEDGYPGAIHVGEKVETNTGVNNGQVKHAMAHRLSGCYHGCTMAPVPDITEPCSRIAVVPMVSGFEEASGKSTVVVTGFLKIFIESYDENTKVLTAWVLGKAAGPSGFTGTQALALRSARLK
ncbi:MAG: pilus assembly protein TadG-related protein [Bacillota bacterium]